MQSTQTGVQGSVSLRESKGQISKDLADAMGFGTARKENVVMNQTLNTYLQSILGTNLITAALGLTAALSVAVGTWTTLNFANIHGGFGGEFSKMIQDVVGHSTNFSAVSLISARAAYIVSAGSGFSAGSGVS